MGVVQTALTAACVFVLAETFVFFLHLASLRSLSRMQPPDPGRWPKVSVILAARNEERDISDAVTSRLADDYPDFELIVVDDRSTDATADRAAAAARDDRRFRAIRIEALPPAWLGKVHALHRGAGEATGEWLLFSDGDVTVRPGTLRRAIAHCVDERIDMLALVPAFDTGSFMVDSVWTVFMRALCVLVDPRAVRDPRSRMSMGSGAFNLVRRDVFDSTPGFEQLRMETGDDVGLGLMVKRAGGSVEMIDGRDYASVPMYRDVGQFLRGIEKNGSTTAIMPSWVLALAFVLLAAVLLSPVAAIAVGGHWLRALGAFALVAYNAAEVAALWVNTRRWLPALAWPAGFALMAYGMVRATWLARRNRGVVWRGTFYPLADLARGRRVSL